MTKTTPAYTRKTDAAKNPPLPGRLARLLTEARWFALAALTLYLILIFSTYSPVDPGL
jgi:S-DNA-T family DNA segregation ATPase FtsK/SpoIIIE